MSAVSTSPIRLLLLSILALTLIPQTQGKKCYVCGNVGGVSFGRSSGDKDLFLGAKSRNAEDAAKCEGSKSDWTSIPCDGLCGKVTGKMNGEEIIVRSCIEKKIVDKERLKARNCKALNEKEDGIDGKACTCDGNECNKSASSGGTPLGMILILGAVVTVTLTIF